MFLYHVNPFEYRKKINPFKEYKKTVFKAEQQEHKLMLKPSASERAFPKPRK
jgi:hypothetical protein